MGDRTLFEILEDLKSGGMPSYNELYYGLLADSALRVHLVGLYKKDKHRDAWKAEAQKVVHRALNTPPKDWLGSNLPGNPDYEKWRGIAKGIAKKIGLIDKEVPDAKR